MTYTLALLIFIGSERQLVQVHGLREYQWCVEQAERMAQKYQRDFNAQVRKHCIATYEGRIN